MVELVYNKQQVSDRITQSLSGLGFVSVYLSPRVHLGFHLLLWIAFIY